MDLNSLLRRVVDQGASDVHLKAGRPPIIRFDGELDVLSDFSSLGTLELENVVNEVTASSRSRLEVFERTGELDTAYQAAVKNNDAEAMDKILHEQFVLVLGDGRTVSRKEILDEARSKSIT